MNTEMGLAEQQPMVGGGGGEKGKRMSTAAFCMFFLQLQAHPVLSPGTVLSNTHIEYLVLLKEEKISSS